MSNIITEITKEQLRTDLPSFRAGDTVRVHVKVVEGTRERIQMYEGVVIKRRGGGVSETFTVRKISYGFTLSLRYAETCGIVVAIVV